MLAGQTFNQSIWNSQDPNTWRTNVDGDMAVLSVLGNSFAPSQATVANMTVIIAAGSLFRFDSAPVTQAQQTSATITAPVSNPRIDRICINAITGALYRVAGTEAVSPSAPNIPSGYLPICQFTLQTSTTAITNSMITDERSAIIAPYPMQQNLITNSRFGLWSNSTLAAIPTPGSAPAAWVPVVDGANAALTAGGSIVANGGIDSATTPWTGINATLNSVGSGKTGNCLQVANSTTKCGNAYQAITTAISTTYFFSIWAKVGTAPSLCIGIGTTTDATNGMYLGTGTYSNCYYSGSVAPAGWTQYSGYFTASTTTTYINLETGDPTSGHTALFDSIVVIPILTSVSVPACYGADTLAMDGWTKTSGLTISRSLAQVQGGSYYSCYFVSPGTGPYYLTWNGNGNTLSPFINYFAGQTIAHGEWVWCNTPSAVRLRLNDGTTSTYSSYHTGNSTWQFLTVHATMASSPSAINIQVSFETACYGYLQEPGLVFGSSIQAGYYWPPMNECINCDTQIALPTLYATNFLIDLESASLFKIPKGIKGAAFTTSQLSNPNTYAAGAWVNCDVNGKIYTNSQTVLYVNTIEQY